MPNLNSETLLIVFVAFTGLAVLMQACVLLGIFLAVRKAVQSGKEKADDFQTKLIPILEIAKDFMEASGRMRPCIQEKNAPTEAGAIHDTPRDAGATA